MARVMLDCRKMPRASNCSLTIAGTEEEVLDTAAAHAVTRHGREDNPALREMLRSGIEIAEPSMV